MKLLEYSLGIVLTITTTHTCGDWITMYLPGMKLPWKLPWKYTTDICYILAMVTQLREIECVWDRILNVCGTGYWMCGAACRGVKQALWHQRKSQLVIGVPRLQIGARWDSYATYDVMKRARVNCIRCGEWLWTLTCERVHRPYYNV